MGHSNGRGRQSLQKWRQLLEIQFWEHPCWQIFQIQCIEKQQNAQTALKSPHRITMKALQCTPPCSKTHSTWCKPVFSNSRNAGLARKMDQLWRAGEFPQKLRPHPAGAVSRTSGL